MPTLIVLIGPTGVGKTELSLRLAETFQTSIVSADSRQLYAELKIGTAAPTPDQLKRVPHQLVGTLHLTDYYSAAQYEIEALEILEKLFTQHEVVILTGGSMMYVSTIFLPLMRKPVNSCYRNMRRKDLNNSVQNFAC